MGHKQEGCNSAINTIGESPNQADRSDLLFNENSPQLAGTINVMMNSLLTFKRLEKDLSDQVKGGWGWRFRIAVGLMLWRKP